MDIELRWILIAISLVVLILIVFDGWRRIKRQQKTLPDNQFDEFDDESLDEDEAPEMLGEMSNPVSNELADDLLEELHDFDEDLNIGRTELTLEEDMSSEMIDDVGTTKKSIVIDDTMDLMPNTIFVLNVFAPHGKIFSGSQLLPALLSLGLRYGDMSIFHRHEHINGNGAVLFSLASATEPGFFNLNTMESQNFAGLTLFLQVPGPAHPINALNLMVQTAKRLAKAVDGHVYDDERQVLSDTSLERRYYFRLRQVLGKI